VTAEDSTESGAELDAPEGRGARRGRSRWRVAGWLVGIAMLLVLAAGGLGAGGYLAMHYHKQSQATAP